MGSNSDLEINLVEALKSMPGGVIVWSSRREIKFFNAFSQKIVPLKLEVGMTANQIVENADKKMLIPNGNKSDFSRTLEDIFIQEGEHYFPTANQVWLKINSKKLKNQDYVWSISDITDEITQQKNLEESEQRFINATGFQTIYEWDAVTGIFNFKRGIYSQTQALNENEEGSGEEYNNFIHPDDKNKYRNHMIRFLKNESEFFDLEYRRLISKDDNTNFIWLRDRASGLRDSKTGKTIKMFGIQEDITEQKLATMRLTSLSNAFSWTAYTSDVSTGKFEFEHYGKIREIAEQSGELDKFKATVDAHLTRIHPEDKKRYSEMMSKLVKGQIDIFHEIYRFIPYGDEFRWFEDKAVAIRNTETGLTEQIIGFNEDVNERQSKLEATQDSLELVAESINSVLIPLVVYDKEFNVLFSSRVWRELSSPAYGIHPDGNWSSQNIITSFEFAFNSGMRVISAMNIKDGQTIEDAFNRNMEYFNDQDNLQSTSFKIEALKEIFNSMQIGEPRMVYMTDENFYIRSITQKLENDNFIMILIDVTELQKSKLESEVLAEKAREASNAKSLFLANMSHELRTPLNAIIGLSSLISEDVRDDGLEDYYEPIDRIQRASTHLLSLINDVLDVSKIEAGKIELHFEKFDLEEVLEDVLLSSEELASQKNNKLIRNPTELIGEIHCDKTRLKQIIYNLVSNSCKFTENGKIEIKSQYKNDDKTQLKIDIIDSGIGMTEAQRMKLFSSFTQADSSTTRKYGGTGLGLSISKELTELMGGTISVTSEIGVGSKFTVVLPKNLSD